MDVGVGFRSRLEDEPILVDIGPLEIALDFTDAQCAIYARAKLTFDGKQFHLDVEADEAR